MFALARNYEYLSTISKYSIDYFHSPDQMEFQTSKVSGFSREDKEIKYQTMEKITWGSLH